MSLPYQGKLIPRAKELRKDATKQENHLWYDFLRGYPMRFQRQKTIDGFIADFYCHVARLVVEVDGSQHYDEQGLAYDKERSAIFAEYGVKVIRFSNLEIEQSFQEVCSAIDLEVRKRVQELEDTPSVKAYRLCQLPLGGSLWRSGGAKASLLEGGGTAKP